MRFLHHLKNYGDLHNSSDDTQPHSIIKKNCQLLLQLYYYLLLLITEPVCNETENITSSKTHLLFSFPFLLPFLRTF